MNVGVVKEIKPDERRVALTPAGARHLTTLGHDVVVEAGCGEGSGFPDEAYRAAGARIADTPDVWAGAELLLKVKEPLPAEYPRIHADMTLFTYLHLAPAPELTKALLASGATCIAYETVETADGALPLLAPMSEAAGRLATQVGAASLLAPAGGRGVLLGGLPGVAPAKVVIIGGGVVGYNAALIAAGMRADVWILDRSVDRVRYLDSHFGAQAKAVTAGTAAQMEEALRDADLVIGAVLVSGARTPRLITRDMLGLLKPGAVAVDVAIDQGGCFETSAPTTHSEPTYTVDGVVHYCVTNMPGATPVTSTLALTNVTLPYATLLAGHALRDAIRCAPELASGVNVIDGHLTSEPVADSLGLPFTPLQDVA